DGSAAGSIRDISCTRTSRRAALETFARYSRPRPSNTAIVSPTVSRSTRVRGSASSRGRATVSSPGSSDGAKNRCIRCAIIRAPPCTRHPAPQHPPPRTSTTHPGPAPRPQPHAPRHAPFHSDVLPPRVAGGQREARCADAVLVEIGGLEPLALLGRIDYDDVVLAGRQRPDAVGAGLIRPRRGDLTRLRTPERG